MDMTATAEIRQLPAGARCFRLRRYYLVVGLLGAAFFSVMGVASTIAAYWNIDGSFPRPRLSALIFGLCGSGFLLLSVSLILAYFRERLFLTGKTIIQMGIIRTRAIDYAQVIHVKWRCWPVGGSIVVRTHFEKATIWLDNFTTKEREEIARFFRETFAHENQDNWPRFEDFTHRASSSQKRTSRNEILFTTLVFACFAGVFIYVGFIGLGIHFLIIGVINTVASFYCLWRLHTYKEPSRTP